MIAQNHRRILWLAGAAMLALPIAPVAAQADNSATSGSEQDIIVTATKRSESVMRVPAPITAITGDQLAKANANSLSDYFNRVPGVVFNDYQPGISDVVIRGIAATT